VSAGVVDVVTAESEGFVYFAGIVCGNRDSTDVMNVEIFQRDELGKMWTFLTNANAGRTTGDFEIAEMEMLAPREVDRVLLRVGSFDDDLGVLCRANDDGLFGGAALGDFEASRVCVCSGLENDFVSRV